MWFSPRTHRLAQSKRPLRRSARRSHRRRRNRSLAKTHENCCACLREPGPRAACFYQFGGQGLSSSLIGRLGSSAFRLSTTVVSTSLAGSCFSSESAPRPFHHGIRRRGGTIFHAALPSN